MKIGNLNNHVSFRQIKIDGDSYWDLRNTSSKEEVESIKDMSLKGFNLGYIVCNDDYGLYLRGIGRDCISIYLGEKPTAQHVKDVIRSYNRDPW